MKEYVARNRVAPDASSGVARKARNVIVSCERRAVGNVYAVARVASRRGADEASAPTQEMAGFRPRRTDE